MVGINFGTMHPEEAVVHDNESASLLPGAKTWQGRNPTNKRILNCVWRKYHATNAVLPPPMNEQ